MLLIFITVKNEKCLAGVAFSLL